jgi:CRISPR system Cascade subunit CasA
MNPTFDLLQSPWVPCIQAKGASVELGLRDALAQAHELRELHGESPLVTAALHRLLLAVLHRVFGPATCDEWAILWKAGRWDITRLDVYLDQWRHGFDLFDLERPFYQARDERVKPKSVSSLVYEVASGNNPTLFDHHTDAEGITLSSAQAARMLVAAQAFGLAGLSGLPQKFTDGPCARGIVFLVQGKTLFETLALNLLRYTDDSPIPRWPDDCPAWEMDDPFSPNRTQPRGYLDYLTWLNRRVLLLPEPTEDGVVVREMTMAPALRLDDSVLNPMTHYRRDEKRGPLPLAFNEGRALWRDSAALFRLGDKGYQPPQAFQWLSELVDEGHLDESQTRRCLALGMSKKQAKVNFYRSQRMPLPMRYLKEKALVESLGTALTMAEETSRQLWGAARTLATFILSPEADLESARQPVREDLDALTHQWAVERRYWSRLELPFRRTMEALPQDTDEALTTWRRTLLKTVWEAFDQIADNLGHDPPTLKAVVRAREQLAAGLVKILPT